jgi:hypothetical protein
MTPPSDDATLLSHGARELPSVRVDAYNAELTDPSGEGFLGDRASNRAFMEILEDWRERVSRGNGGEDPLEGTLAEARPTHEIDRGELDELLLKAGEDPEAAGLVHSAIEDFAQETVGVVRRFLRLQAWRGTERIAVGGGFLGAHVGLMAVGRVGILLKAGGDPVRLVPVSRPPDEAALCGAAHLAPPGTLRGFDAVLAVDIGGTNMRAGLVALRLDEAPDLSLARVGRRRALAPRRRGADPRRSHGAAGGDAARPRRARGGRGAALGAFVGVGCPGVILPDGTIERGGQNLPGGGWEGEGFNLPRRLAEALPDISGAGRRWWCTTTR